MPLEFIDRVPSKPRRVKVTPESGTAYFATIDRADEPSVEGTPLNAASLNAAQETLVYTNATSVSTWKRIYVSTTGDDDNTGTAAATAMATIKGAIRKYAKWHKYLDIYLADGEYTEDIGTLSTDQCNLSIRSISENKDAVTINSATMLESHITLLRLFNLTLNMTASTVRPISVNAGMFYANGVRINVPTDSGNSCVNVYNGCSAWLMNCVLNAGTTAAVYGNQALHIKVMNCTSERTLTRGFSANNGTIIEYTPTLTAKEMAYEANGGKCILVSSRADSIAGAMGSLSGQYKTSDGLLLQWGAITITPTAANEATVATVTFPLAYSETPIVTATPVSAVPENISVSVMRTGDYVPNNKLQIGIVLTRSGLTATSIHWLAIGKGVV